MANPWLAQSISEFCFFCCPECNYRAKSEDHFEHHAVNKHPMSIDFFAAAVEPDEPVKEELGNTNVTANQTNIDIDGKECIEAEVKFEVEEQDDSDFEPIEKPLSDNNAAFEDKVHKCPQCCQYFSGMGEMAVHFNMTHEKIVGQRKCPICGKMSDSIYKMRKHVESVHENITVTCPICDNVLRKSGLYAHMRILHQGDRLNKPFKCSLCVFSTHAEKYLNAHVYKNHEKHKFTHECDICSKKFPFPHELKEHKAVEHEGQKRITRKPKKFVCDQCGKGFLGRSLFEDHVMKDTCDGPNKVKYLCDHCPASYRSYGGFHEHLRNYHSDLGPDVVPKTAPKVHRCLECNREFKSRRTLIDHQNVKHKNQLTVECKFCDKKFPSVSRMKSHIVCVHQREKCSECGLEISNKYWLRRHLTSAHGIKQEGSYQCDHCSKMFFSMSSKLKHMKANHSDENQSLQADKF